ncbi:hypothetical protein P5V15_003220 [Pogonomyrmex californicus]
MRRASFRVAPRMQPGLLFCWCVIATATLALAAWQENVRPKMYVQLDCAVTATPHGAFAKFEAAYSQRSRYLLTGCT